MEGEGKGGRREGSGMVSDCNLVFTQHSLISPRPPLSFVLRTLLHDCTPPLLSIPHDEFEALHRRLVHRL